MKRVQERNDGLSFTALADWNTWTEEGTIPSSESSDPGKRFGEESSENHSSELCPAQEKRVFSVSNGALPRAASGEVLLSTMWNQSGPIFSGNRIQFNEYCPIDPQTNEHSLTGCTNTAAAQILYYWLENGALDLQLTLNSADAYLSDYNGQKTPIDESESNAESHGYLSFAKVNAALADFSLYSAEDIAALNFACGVVQEASYSSTETGTAWDLDLFFRAGMVSGTIIYAYSGYAVNPYFVSSSGSGGAASTITEAGFEVIKENLQAGSPVGTSYPGHALVIDGYDEDRNAFHINYGWGASGTRERFESYGQKMTGTGWYTQEEMNQIQFYYFLIDIAPSYDGSPIEVTDSRIYGTGTFLRAIERSNSILGKNTVSCSDSVAGANLDFSTTITVTGDLLIENYNLDYALTSSSNIYGFTIDSSDLVMDQFSGTMVFNVGRTKLYGIYGSGDSSVQLSLNGGGIFAGNYSISGSYDSGTNRIQAALAAYRVSDELAVADLENSRTGYAVFCNSSESNAISLNDSSVIIGNLMFGSGDDRIEVEDHSLLVGDLRLNDGNDSISVKNGSRFSGNLYLGGGEDTLKIDNSSSLSGAFYSSGLLGVTMTIDSVATASAIISIRNNTVNFTNAVSNHILLDLTGAGNGEYILLDANGAAYESQLKNLNFTLQTGADTSFDLSLSTGSISRENYWLRYENSQVILTVDGSDKDVIPPSLPDGLTQEIHVRDVVCSWNPSSDNQGVGGYRFRFGTTPALRDAEEVTGNSFTLSGLANGTYYWQVQAVDKAGNVSSWSAVQSFQINVSEVPPVLTVEADTSAPARSVVLTVSADDGSPVYYNTVSADSEEWILCDGTVTVTENATYFFRSTNENGNTGTAQYQVSNIDRVAPTITAISISPGTPTAESVAVSARFSDDIQLAVQQYRFGTAGEWLDYTGSVTVSENGTLYFRAVDAAGNETVESCLVSNIDRTPPSDPVPSADTTDVTNRDVLVSAQFSSDSAVREYSLNGRDWLPYVSGVVMTENGSVYFRALDEAGNSSNVVEYRVSNIDKSAPSQPEVSVSTDQPTNQNVIVSARFAPESVLNEYRVNDGEWQVYDGAIEMEANGSITFRSRNAMGNYSEITWHVTNIDRVAPEKPVVSANVTELTNQDVLVTALFDSDASVREYSLDGENWNAYGDGVLMSGNGVLYFRAFDAAGNASPIAEYQVTNIDRVAPEQPVVSADVTELTNQDVVVTAVFSADSAVREYSFDGRSWMPYEESGIRMERNGTLYFRSVDAAGNESAVVEYVVGNIDKTAPAQPIVSVSTEDATNQDVIVSALFAPDSVRNEYQVNDGAWMVYTEAVVMEENGRIVFRSTDEIGNVSESRYEVVNIDKIPPEKPVVSANVTELTNQDVVVTAVFDSDAAVREYSLSEGREWFSYEDGVVFESNGTVWFRASDLAGNISETAVYEVSNIDRTAPVIQVSGDNAGVSAASSVTVVAAFTDETGLRSREYSLDGRTWLAYSGPITVTRNGLLRFRASDLAGNTSETSYLVSNLAVSTAVQDGMSVTVKKYNATFAWEKYEVPKGVKVRYEVMVDGIVQRKLVSGTKFTLKNASIGEHTFAVRALLSKKGSADTWSDWSNTISQYVADVTRPKTGKLSLVQTGEDALRVSWTPGTDNMGVVRYVVTCGEETREVDASRLSAEFTSTAGRVTATVTAYDAAGLAGKTVKKSLTMKDMTAPSQVTGLRSEGINNKSGGVLAWDPASDNVGVTRYEVTIGNVRTIRTSKTSVKIGKLAAGTYKYTVVAFDKAKNAGIVSEEGEFTVADVLDPKIRKFSCKVENQTARFSWNAVDESGSIVRSELWLDGERYADTTGLDSFVLNGLDLGQHAVELKVWDAAGNDASKTAKCRIRKQDPVPLQMSAADPAQLSLLSENRNGMLAVL